MSIFVDLAVIAIILLSTFIGYKRGLIKVAITILSFFVAIILAFTLCNPLADYLIANTQIDETIQGTIEKALSSKELENMAIEEEKTNETSEKASNMPEVITNYIGNQVKAATETAQNEIAKTVSTTLTRTIIVAISFIGIFIIAKIILLLLKLLTDAIAELPLIKQFNKLGGVLYGVVKGFFIVYVIFAIISIASPLLGNIALLQWISDSLLGNLLYNNNLLLKILFK